jgi:hypothetical protein
MLEPIFRTYWNHYLEFSLSFLLAAVKDFDFGLFYNSYILLAGFGCSYQSWCCQGA